MGGPTHEDRDRIRELAAADFPQLYTDHGGRHRGKALHCLFHEDRTPSARIHRGRLQCFVCNLSLDPIEFIQRMLGTDFRGALQYFGDRYGVPIGGRELTAAERRDYARRRAIAETEAKDLVAWRDELLVALREARDWRFLSYHRALRLILAHSLNHPRGSLWADLADACESEYQQLDAHIARLKATPFSTLLPFFRKRDRAEAEA